MKRIACIVAVALIASACGSGGGGGGTGPELFLAAPSVPGMSGYIRGAAGPPTVIPSTTSVIWVGDTGTGFAEWGYYRFNLAGLPPGAVIVEAVMHTYQGAEFNQPFAALGGQVLVDHVNLGTALDPADYTSTNVIALAVAVLSTGPNPIGPRSANVTSAVQADINAGRLRTDVRLRFPIASDFDASFDDVRFNNQQDDLGVGVLPRLEIRYRAP